MFNGLFTSTQNSFGCLTPLVPLTTRQKGKPSHIKKNIIFEAKTEKTNEDPICGQEIT